MIKKYNINEANSVIDDLFEKYAKQYQKKKQYDKRYFEQDKTKLKEQLQHLQTGNDRLKARVNKLLALNNQYKFKKNQSLIHCGFSFVIFTFRCSLIALSDNFKTLA